MKDLNSLNESQVMPLEKSFSKKLTKLRISPERERNIRYTNEKLEVDQIPNKHPSNKKIKCVDYCTIDANIEQTTLKRAKFAATIIKLISQKNSAFPSILHFQKLKPKGFSEKYCKKI